MENVETKEMTEKQNKKGAKDYSLIAQIVSAVWIGGWNSFQFVKEIMNGVHIDIWDIILSGISIAACFSPVYVSILLDKIKEIKSVK